MSRPTATAVFAFLALVSAPLWAVTDPTPAELEARRARVEQLRKNPEQFARLRRDLQAFLQLPEERRDRLLRLDQELHAQNPATRDRLLRALDRYADWLERLPDKERQAVEQAPTREARLAVIRELRDRQWMAAQPRALREQWEKLQAEERDRFVRKLRADERQRRREWLVASRFWKELEGRVPLPVRPADFDVKDKETSSAQVLIEEYLWPMLSEEEKERLKKAEGRWPDYPQALVEVADRHPFALPGEHGPRFFRELPREIQTKLSPKLKDAPKAVKAVKAFEGAWPEFAVKLVEWHQARKGNPLPLPNELWAFNYDCLLKPMREFVDQALVPRLTGDEKIRYLHANKQGWPTYPQTIQELARAHGLQPPWQTALPGPRERWDGYRALNP